MMKTSEAINEIAAAIAKAQGKMELAAKDSNNPHFGSKYADLAALVSVSREPLAENGVCLLQDVEIQPTPPCVFVTTKLIHASGQWIEFTPLLMPIMKEDAHGIGSAITYGRRYSMGAALGLAAEDDDGNAASGKPSDPSPAQQKYNAKKEQEARDKALAERKGLPLATPEQLTELAEIRKKPENEPLIKTILNQAKATAPAQLTQDQAAKALVWLNQKLAVATTPADPAPAQP